MSNRVIVMVSDLDDTKHGEINVLESPAKAARMVEALLESGFEQERIRIFTGDEMGMQVAHRPVVALVSGLTTTNGAAPEPSAEEEPNLEGAEATANAEVQAEVIVAPFVKNGVRFSTQFRPA